MTQATRSVEGAGISVDLHSERTWLTADAVLTGLNGLAYLLVAGPLVELIGSEVSTFRIVGAFLLVFTALVALIARSNDPRGSATRMVVTANALWVLASLVVAGTGAPDLTTIGRVWAAAQGVVVGALTTL